MSERTIYSSFLDFLASRLKKLRESWLVSLILLGPACHLGYLTLTFGIDIVHIAQYAELSLALPIAIYAMLLTMLAILMVNVKRRSARIGILILSIVYIVVAVGFPYIDAVYSVGKLLTLSPWLVHPWRSIEWTILSAVLIIAYGFSAVWAILFEAIKGFNPHKKEHVQLLRRAQRVKCKGTIAFVAALVLGAFLITGNTLWYEQTYTLHYEANSTTVEYWLGADEQEVTGIFPIWSSTSVPVVAGANVTVDLATLRAGPDPFYAARFAVNGTLDLNYNLGGWYWLEGNYSRLFIRNVQGTNLINVLEGARNMTRPLNLTCTGYNMTRLAALRDTKACMVISGGLGRGVPRNYTNIRPEFNVTMYLYDEWGIKAHAVCGLDSFLEEAAMYTKILLEFQDTRVKGPACYRRVIEGCMFNIEKIPATERDPAVAQWVYDNYGWNVSGEELTFGESAWNFNTLTEKQYWEYVEQYNDVLDNLYYNTTWGNGTQDETLRFKLVNCGIQENLIDYLDGDPDYARYYHNLGFGTHFGVDGYMFYRGADEPYWTYGYAKLLAEHPPTTSMPGAETMVFLGCMNTDPYRYDFELEDGSRFKIEGSDAWVRDVNGDGLANGFDVLMLDIMMCRAAGVDRVNLWPGPGPRSLTCCDYREYPRALMPDGDFFVEMSEVLGKSWDIQFKFIPANEHFWDKELVDISMNFMRPEGWWVVPLFVAFYFLFAFLMANNLVRIERKAGRPSAAGTPLKQSEHR